MEWNEIEKLINREDFDALESSRLTTYKISNRTKKTFYYASGKNPLKDTLSYSLTKEAVESFRRLVPTNSGKIGPYYASRVSRNACISPCSLLLALIYVERISKSNPSYLHSASSSEIFLISMLVASKFMFDEGTDDEVYNDEWSASSQVDVKHVKSLEKTFLNALNWKAFVSPLEFQQMLQMMETKLALKSGLSRGWFSYTDFQCLLQMKQISANFNNVCFSFIQAFGLFMIVYVGILSACVGCMLIKSNTKNEPISYKYHKTVELPIQDIHMENGLVEDIHMENGTIDDIQLENEIPVKTEISCPPCNCLNENTTGYHYNHYDVINSPFDVDSIMIFSPDSNRTRQYQKLFATHHLDLLNHYDLMVT